MNLKAHPIYTYLLISECGQVFSTRSNRYLKYKPQGRGYCSLSTEPFGWKEPAVNLKVHRLVAQTYIPNPENKPQVNHKDGDKSNNHVSNLEWVTPQENLDHAVNNGLMKPAIQRKGLEAHRCKLTQESLDQLLKLKAEGKSNTEIGRLLGIHRVTVRKWINR